MEVNFSRKKEDPEKGVNGAISQAVERFMGVFPALRSRNYQLFFTGQFISLVGTWLQVVAQGWLVLQLTNSAFLVGVVAAASTAPTLFLSLFGGVIVDRFSKRRILLFTQSASMALAFVLGVLTVVKVITVAQITFLAFLLGVVNAMDAPARQAFLIEMVEREALGSAIALNSGIFNAARVIGPSAAGILIAIVGTGGAFIINSVSYTAVITALFFIRAKKSAAPELRMRPLKAIGEGVLYSFTHPVIRALLLFTAITSVFGWSYTDRKSVV